MDDDTRSVLLWLLERALPQPVNPCNRCGHDSFHHRLNDDGSDGAPTDDNARFRCVFPMPSGPAVYVCQCRDFIMP